MRSDEVGALAQELRQGNMQRELARRAEDSTWVEPVAGVEPLGTGRSSRQWTTAETVAAAVILLMGRYRS